MGAPSLDFGGWEVAAEGVGEVVGEIAFGALIPDADGFWGDAVGTKFGGEPEVGDLFTFTHFQPWAVGAGVQGSEEVAGEDALEVFDDEDAKDVEEE